MLSTLCVNELFINTTTKVYELANVKSKYEGYKSLATRFFFYKQLHF